MRRLSKSTGKQPSYHSRMLEALFLNDRRDGRRSTFQSLPKLESTRNKAPTLPRFSINSTPRANSDSRAHSELASRRSAGFEPRSKTVRKRKEEYLGRRHSIYMQCSSFRSFSSAVYTACRVYNHRTGDGERAGSAGLQKTRGSVVTLLDTYHIRIFFFFLKKGEKSFAFSKVM